MIARLTVGIPFAIAVPDGAEFPAYSYDDGGYRIVARPPVRTDQPVRVDLPGEIELDGAKGLAANAIQFDFLKSEFSRRRDAAYYEPPAEVMERVVTNFLARLRYVTRASQVHYFGLSRTTWRLQYLNDDGSELAADPELIRALGGRAMSVSLVAVTPTVWECIHELEPTWVAPAWDDILLDAVSALPAIGTAVVLAATAE